MTDIEKLIAAAKELIEMCPVWVDQDTVSRGKQPSDTPDQTVLNMSVSYRIYDNLREAVKTFQSAPDDENY